MWSWIRVRSPPIGEDYVLGEKLKNGWGMVAESVGMLWSLVAVLEAEGEEEGRGEGGLSHGPAGKLGDRRGGEMRWDELTGRMQLHQVERKGWIEMRWDNGWRCSELPSNQLTRFFFILYLVEEKVKISYKDGMGRQNTPSFHSFGTLPFSK